MKIYRSARINNIVIFKYTTYNNNNNKKKIDKLYNTLEL